MNPKSEDTQGTLFHEDIYDALGTTIQFLGGYKKVALMLWPDMRMESAYARLKASLDSTKPEKLSPSEVNLLIREGRKINCHAIMKFLGDDCLYQVTPIEPEDEKERTQKAFIEATQSLIKAIEKLNKASAINSPVRLHRS